MNNKLQNMVLMAAILISLVTYLFWGIMPKNSFYVGNALFIFTLSIYVFMLRKNFLTFLLISLSLNNLLDELFFDPTKLGWSELVLGVLTLIIGFYKYVWNEYRK